MKKLQTLEALRAFAALLVVLFHTQSVFRSAPGHIPFGYWSEAGDRGVDLFFVLSGFIITHVHRADIGRPDRIWNFTFNRIARVYPFLWCMTALAVALYTSGFGGAEKAYKLAPAAIAASLLLLPQDHLPLVNVSWTLTYEMFFYCLFGVLILSRRTGLWLICVWQAATLAMFAFDIHLGLAGYYARIVSLEFGVGIVCALLFERFRDTRGTVVWAGVLAVGTASFLAGLLVHPIAAWNGVPCAFGAGAMILALASLESAGGMRVPGRSSSSGMRPTRSTWSTTRS